jgi:hypothetical protein
LYYNLNFTSWVRLANTLKLKIFLNMRLTDPTGAAAGIDALIADVSATGLFISNQNENFIWRYGTTTADPDARAPRFVAQYPAGGGDYQANWLMWHMFHGYDAVHRAAADPGDPRIRFYFYRQVLVNSTSTNELRCLSESLPSHYPGSTGTAIFTNTLAGLPPLGVGPAHPTNDATDIAWNRTFCVPTDRGYWGRDHIDPQGIPPDGQLRTAYGVYPYGGRFDNNSATGISAGVGQRGAGFMPIMMRSYVSFMLSEAALFLTLNPPALTARAYYINGLNQSFTDVRDWAVNGTYSTNGAAASPNEGTTIGTFYPSGQYSTDVTNYVTAATAAYDNRLLVSADEAMNYVGREFWIASYGNGVEAYNLYRRTGKPTGMQPVINPVPGSFPRSYWYPANFANLNNTVDQKADMSGKVFWDASTTNLDF